MSGNMILKAAALCAGLMTAACAAGGGQTAETEPGLERLVIVTDTGEHAFQVEIADDDAERSRGLMYRPPLADDRGMLFQFPEAAERTFWMRNTPSSLDIIYVSPDGEIISIARNTTPNSDAPIPSNGAASGVIELRAGRAAEISADPGDEVRHPFFD